MEGSLQAPLRLEVGTRALQYTLLILLADLSLVLQLRSARLSLPTRNVIVPNEELNYRILTETRGIHLCVYVYIDYN